MAETAGPYRQHKILLQPIKNTGMWRAVCSCGGYASIETWKPTADRLGRRHVAYFDKKRRGVL
jgi:hypothetical protein